MKMHFNVALFVAVIISMLIQCSEAEKSNANYLRRSARMAALGSCLRESKEVFIILPAKIPDDKETEKYLIPFDSAQYKGEVYSVSKNNFKALKLSEDDAVWIEQQHTSCQMTYRSKTTKLYLAVIEPAIKAEAEDESGLRNVTAIDVNEFDRQPRGMYWYKEESSGSDAEPQVKLSNGDYLNEYLTVTGSTTMKSSGKNPSTFKVNKVRISSDDDNEMGRSKFIIRPKPAGEVKTVDTKADEAAAPADPADPSKTRKPEKTDPFAPPEEEAASASS